MEKLKIDLSKVIGKIKNMNSVNNGPIRNVRGVDNFGAFKNAKIPYARIHDASFDSRYGGEFTVDVHRIFRSFDADEKTPHHIAFRRRTDISKQ